MRRSGQRKHSWDHSNVVMDAAARILSSRRRAPPCQRSYSIAVPELQEMQAEHGTLAMAPDLDAAISSIARASLRNLAVDMDDATSSADGRRSSVIRQMSESDISTQRNNRENAGRFSRALSSASSSRRDSGARRPSNLSASGVSSSSYHSLNNDQQMELLGGTEALPVEIAQRPASPLDNRVPTLIRIVEADEEEQQQTDSREPSLRSSAPRQAPVVILVDGVAREPADHAAPLNATLSSQVSVSLDSSAELDAVHFHIGDSPMKPGRHYAATARIKSDGANRRRAQLHRRALSGESSASTSDDADLRMATEEAMDAASNDRRKKRRLSSDSNGRSPRRRTRSAALSVRHPYQLDETTGAAGDDDDDEEYTEDSSQRQRKMGVGTESYVDTEDDLIDDCERELFIQLDELYLPYTAHGVMEWRETGRWIKYEEAVEAGAERFGKPKVASLSFHGLLELRHCIQNGAVMLDLRATSTEAAMERIVDQMSITDQVRPEDRNNLLQLLLLRHRHVGETGNSPIHRQHSYNSLYQYFNQRSQTVVSPLFGGGRMPTTTRIDPRIPFASPPSQPVVVVSGNKANGHMPLRMRPSMSMDGGDLHPDRVDITSFEQEPTEEQLLQRSVSGASAMKRVRTRVRTLKFGGRRVVDDQGERSGPVDADLMKRLPPGAEAASVMVGSTSYMHKPTIAFVRLNHGVPMNNLVEVPVPIRFMFILLGPLHPGLDYHEVGRSISTLLANKRFRDAAYGATMREDLVQAINEFLDDSIVLPPGDWDKERLLNYDHLRSKSHMIRQRRRALTRRPSELDRLLLEEQLKWAEDPLRRTGRLFGGFCREGRRRFRHFASDFTDALNVQCLMSVVFIFLTCCVPALAFGAILSEATDGWIGVTETLLATGIGGVIFALTSTQPLMVLGVCGPMLIFEESLYIFCSVNGLQFLSVRFWVSVWALLLCLITVAWEGPLLIRYVTRFSDDIFGALISVIFLTESLRFVNTMFTLHPVMTAEGYCLNNASRWMATSSPVMTTTDSAPHNYRHYTGDPKPNTALLSCILISGTFLIAYLMRQVRNSRYFGRQVRKALGDFGLSLAVVVMVLIDRFALGDDSLTVKLRFQSGFEPTLSDKRGWLVLPYPVGAWVPAGALLPGILLFLILFTETEVCEMILAQKENCLKKGTGYHWDLLLSGVLLVGSSLFGMPWLCAASVRSTAHMNSLTKYRLRAPGQKPKITGVIEQRCTALVLNLLIGLTLLATEVLKTIPVAVLFGVFLYLGMMNLSGAQMLTRSILFLVPVKYHPNAIYCIRVRTWRMHMYTGIQVLCFCFVFTIKSIKTTAFAFPFAILLCVVVRQCVIPWLFTNFELLALDGAEEDQEDDMDFYEESRLPALSSAMQVNKICVEQ
uniref:Anion exchange protein n=2 Tax=Plectus sambesii TaxID=2011161 RepID=A0A914WIA8_9BILA